MIMRWGKTAACLLAGLAIVSGCGKSGQESDGAAQPTKQPAESTKPVTITLYTAYPASIDFEKLGQSVTKKYPHITFQVIKRGKGMEYADWIASKTPVDIIYESTAFTVDRIKTNGLHTDLQEYMKLQNFKSEIFEPNVLAHAISSNSESKLYGLPFSLNRYGTFYNKNLFDRYGVGYPKDGMKWDEVYELAKKMSRVDAGTPIYGFTTVPNNVLLNNQLSLGPLDLKEDKAAVNNDNWKMLFENVRRFADIPNNALVPNTDFVKGNIAMVLDSGTVGQSQTPVDFEWDLVSVPELPQKPKTGFKPASLSLFLSSTSQHKEEAFKVMAYLVSNEVQMEMTKQAVGTPLANTDVRKSFGQDLPQWKGKNVSALYYYPDAPAAPARADNLTNVSVSFSELFTKKEDTNTVMRNFEEQINKAIETEKSKMQPK